jgi:hypothetical protein
MEYFLGIIVIFLGFILYLANNDIKKLADKNAALQNDKELLAKRAEWLAPYETSTKSLNKEVSALSDKLYNKQTECAALKLENKMLRGE